MRKRKPVALHGILWNLKTFLYNILMHCEVLQKTRSLALEVAPHFFCFTDFNYKSGCPCRDRYSAIPPRASSCSARHWVLLELLHRLLEARHTNMKPP